MSTPCCHIEGPLGLILFLYYSTSAVFGGKSIYPEYQNRNLVSPLFDSLENFKYIIDCKTNGYKDVIDMYHVMVLLRDEILRHWETRRKQLRPIHVYLPPSPSTSTFWLSLDTDCWFLRGEHPRASHNAIDCTSLLRPQPSHSVQAGSSKQAIKQLPIKEIAY